MMWRVLFAAAGVLIVVGGLRHPRDMPMAQMLAHPDWWMSHVLVTAGFVAFTAALIVLRRDLAAGPRGATMMRLVIAATVLQTIEMILHTAAYVDAVNLAAGRSTPIFTTHMRMALVAYPIFGAAIVAFIVSATRRRVLGSPWIAWLGIAGAVAHGLSVPLVVGLGIGQAGILFPMLLLLALWLVLAAVWPASRLRAAARSPA